MSIFDYKIFNNREKNYLNKYYINDAENQKFIIDKRQKIFNNSSFGNQVNSDFVFFNKGFSLSFFMGGILLIEENLEAIKKIMLNYGENYFFIVKDDLDNTIVLKYPRTISWAEITDCMEEKNQKDFNNIVYELFSLPEDNYFIYGESCNWGIYAAMDYVYPIEFWGIKNEGLLPKISNEDKKSLISWYPDKTSLFLKSWNS